MSTRLNPEIDKQILAALKPVFAKAGYKRKDHLWYHFGPELVKLFEFQAGMGKPIAYFNLGFYLRSKLKALQPKTFDCEVYGRLNLLDDRISEMGDFWQPEDDIKSRLESIITVVESVAIPFLERPIGIAGLNEMFTKGQLRGFKISETMRQRFKMV